MLIQADVVDESSASSLARHDPVKLSNALAEGYRKHRGHRRRLPRVRLNLDQSRTDYGKESHNGHAHVSEEQSRDKVTPE